MEDILYDRSIDKLCSMKNRSCLKQKIALDETKTDEGIAFLLSRSATQ